MADDVDDRLRCPKCDHKSLRRRGANLKKNVLRRTVGNPHHRWVCNREDCEWSGSDDDIVEHILKDFHNDDSGFSVLDW